MEEVGKKLSALTEGFDKELYYDPEDLLKAYSYEKGIKDEKIEIAKSMLKKNINIKDIIEITGLSIKEINNLTSK